MDPTPIVSGRVAASAGSRLVNGVAVVALLYFGREVLIPITLALILGLLVAPLVRQLKRLGMGPVSSVLGAVCALTVFMVGLALVLGSQLAEMAARLPQYAETIGAKLQLLRTLTLSRMELMQGEASRMFNTLSGPSSATGAVPVEVHEPTLTPLQMLSQVFAALWGPLGTAMIVLIVLVFVLLENESLRDRFIRLTGGNDLRATTLALNDASERLSRYFVSQFAVNAGVGATVGLGLTVIGLPGGMLWAVLSGVLRFIPYVGIWLAALAAGLLAIAIDPGWTVLLATVLLYAVVELIAGQAVEPYLYGHSTGLSPLSVVIAAIFWSWIWGPIGLLVSTPLTLCLVVAGRHTQALAFVDVLLGDTPALTLSERFYQRALSGDADEILATARIFLQRRSFARYCDEILWPALELAGADHDAGRIGPEQQRIVGDAILRVIEVLGSDMRKHAGRQRRATVLDEHSLGWQLRHRREDALGRWQGPLQVAPGSVVLCLSMGSLREDLRTELLVRVLRGLAVDARHFSAQEFESPPPEDAARESVALVYIVSDLRLEGDRERRTLLAVKVREQFPGAALVGVVPNRPLSDAERQALLLGLDFLTQNYETSAQYALDRLAPPAPAVAAAERAQR